MDHVFEVESWLRPQPEEEFGDFIDFREYSFFDNDGVPESVKSSRWWWSLFTAAQTARAHRARGVSRPPT